MKTDAEIQSMNTDWGRDPISGLPFSGQSVQTFIKRTFNSKVGAGLFDATDMALYLFKDEADKEAFDNDRTKVELIIGTIPMRFETTQYRIRVTPSGNTNMNVSINANKIELDMELQAERRELGEPIWQPTNQDIGVRVYVDARNTGNYEEIPELAQTILATSGHLKVDVRQYLPVGLNRVRFYFYAVDDTTLSSSLVYNITLAEMYIEEWGNTWDKPLIESIDNGNYHFGGFKIVGTLGKSIHIDVSTALTQVAYYERDIAGLEAIESPYYFTRGDGLDLQHPVSKYGESLPALTTGIYSVKVWLTSGELTTEDEAVTYNIMYVAPGDEYSAKLVVMNYSGQEVNNYDESAHLCDYSIYNAGQTYGTPTIVITPYIAGTPESSTTITSSMFTSTKQSLIHSINVVTSRDNLTIRYEITLTGGNSQYDVSPVNNTEIFPSVDGATFYLNTSLRSNGESTKETVYNTAGSRSVALSSVNWTGMSWVDGIDGWDTDDTGRKCLFLPARTRLEIPNDSFNFLSGENITIEMCYKVMNVSDYSANVITIAQNPTQNNFLGLRIRPTNITVHSGSDSTSGNDIYQGTNLCDEEVVHLVLTIQRSFGDHNGFNLVTGYVNGVKNFQFSYLSGTIWSSRTATAIFGSDSADLCLYMVRAYSKPISSSGAEDNWLNSLVTLEEKTAYRHFIDSILQSSTRNISYDKIKDEGKYNFFVVEMTSGGTNVPTMSYPNGGRSNIEMHYGLDENGVSMSDRDWKIYDVETKGQGTTSMNYWLWNIRWRIDKTDSTKKRDVAYYDSPVISGGVRTFVELPKSSSKVVWFDGEGNHPAVKRITAKINFASSMQSHKMGATKAYNVLHDSLLEGAMLNEAQVIASNREEPIPTVAVYQYPAFGFQKIVTNGKASYTFIGLFTIGPDKGDKPTFGYDLVDENDLVTLEGVDHTPQMTKFNVPWDEQAAYFVNDGGDGFLATKAPSGNYQNAVEVGNAGAADTADPSEAMPVLVSKFKSAYDVVYNNSTLIFPIALDDATWGAVTAEGVLANINADITNFQRTRYALDQRLSYADMEFWIEGEYNLYHFEYESGQYVSGYKTSGEYVPLSLLTDTGISASELEGLTLDAQNIMFLAVREHRFLQQAPTYWDMNELAFNYIFLLIFGATDNFAKNQYPYCMGGKWRFRQDDLDTIEDIDNNGGQTKPYYIEFGDHENGSPYFAGSNSVLWNLVNSCMWEDYTVNNVSYLGLASMGKKVMEQMASLSRGDNAYDGFVKFFEKYFWGNAQEYFPQSAYNIDGNIKYEAAWLTGRSFSANPLRQSLGNHYSAERLWVRDRAMYCMSMFKVGSFGNYEDATMGRIQFRPIDLGSMTLTPAKATYPCLIIGDNNIRPTSRTGAGTEMTFDSLVGDGQTVYTIQGVNNLTSLGDLKDLQLGPLDGGTFNVSGKKLVSLKFGDATETVTTNLVNLAIDSVNGLPCLEVIDLRNAEDASGSLDLTNCKRIKEVYTEGTNIAAVVLPRGSKIEKLHLSEHVTTLSYQVIKYLYDLVLPPDASNITLLYLEECDALDSMGTLEDIYDTDGQSLAYIKLLWNTEKNASGSQIRMLSHIMQDLDKDGEDHPYNGVDANGSGSSSIAPSLEGKLIAEAYYQSDIETLADGATPSDSTEHPGMKVIQAPYFGTLYISYSLDNRYIDFVDPDVVAALADSNIGDGTGVTMVQAAAVTDFGTGFRNKTNISIFNEFVYFTSLTSIPANAFNGCTALQSIIIPERVTSIGSSAFANCTSLSEITFTHSGASDLNVNGDNTFQNAPITKVNIPSIYVWMRTYFASDNSINTNHHLYIDGDEVLDVVCPNNRSAIYARAFYRCRYITSVSIPSGYTTIGAQAFYGCGALTGDLILPSTITSIGSDAFYGCMALSSLTIPSSVANVQLEQVEGGVARNGTLTIEGNLLFENMIASTTITSKNVIVAGNLYNRRNAHMFGMYVESIRIAGNCDLGTAYIVYAGSGSNSSLKFIEIMGTVTGNRLVFSADSANSIVQDANIHLGYNGVSATPAQIFGTSSSGIGTGRINKVYVGAGNSQAEDEAVLAMYQSDSAWSIYTNKLDIWYNYTGPYKETN